MNNDSTPKIGLSSDQLQKLVDILKKTLADEVVLTTKLRKYHWNVTGPNFFELHELFEKQYEETFEIADEVAEYIRIYGEMAPGTLSEFLELTRLQENPGTNGTANEMLQDVLEAHEALIRNLRTDALAAGDEIGDPAVEDFLIGILHKHQKMAWMIRASIPR